MELTKNQEKIYMELSNIIDFNYNDKVALKNRVFDYINACDINLKQALNEIREYIYKNSIPLGLIQKIEEQRLDFEGDINDILKIIDKVGGNNGMDN